MVQRWEGRSRSDSSGLGEIMSQQSNRIPVSVIVPCFKSIDTILRALDSVFHQSKLPAEIILVDDFSNDDQKTVKLLKEIQRKYDDQVIHVIELSCNVGPGTARNVAWNKATQPYIAFLDADDSWHPQKLEIQYDWMAKHPEAILTAHASTQIEEGQATPLLIGVQHAKRINKLRLLISNYLPARSVMLKRDIEDRFSPGKRHAEDYLLWLTIVLKGLPAYYLNLTMAYSYKGDFDEIGLNADLKKSHAGVNDAFRQLRRAHKISYPTLIFLLAYSWIKYLRRLWIVGLKKLFNWLGN